MTNVSVYAYEDINAYMDLYPKGQDKITEDHLLSLWLSKKTIAFITDSREKVARYRPDISKSVLYFDGGEKEWERYNDGFEYILEVTIKNNMITFVGKEQELSLTVAKYVGEKMEGHVRGYILYDESRDRLNVIMTPVQKITA